MTLPSFNVTISIGAVAAGACSSASAGAVNPVRSVKSSNTVQRRVRMYVLPVCDEQALEHRARWSRVKSPQKQLSCITECRELGNDERLSQRVGVQLRAARRSR